MADASQRPNIVWFITDDTGFDMLGFTGGPVLTPNLDRLARKGVICSEFHTAASTCCPSRYSYLTGMYPGHCPAPRFLGECPTTGPYNLGFNVDLLPPQANVAGILKANGYVTGYTGKWHAGTPRTGFHGHRFNPDDDPADPEVARKLREDYDAMCAQVRSNGFDYAEAICWGNTDGRPLKALQYHNLEWHTQAALDFIDRYKDSDQPLFIKMATTTIHGPHHIESLETDGREVEYGYLDAMPDCQPSRRSVLERIEAADGVELNHQTAGALWMDDAFGAVIDRMEALGLAENTIFIWSTDHGPGTIKAKFSCHHSGMHIPFCMRWDGSIPPGSTSDALLQNVDVLPTLLDMLNIELPEGVAFDGLVRTGQLCGRAGDDREDLYFEYGRGRAVRTRKWKYIAWRYTPQEIDDMMSGKVEGAYSLFGNGTGGDYAMHMHPGYWDADQLYDLENDPDEQKNLFDDPAYADVAADMQARLRRYLDGFEHPFDLAVHPFVKSEAFRELTRVNMADTRIYEYDYYTKHAY